MSGLLDQLNKKQSEAVEQIQGPVLILAGAGSGKTRALTFRVAYLIKNKKVPPKNILAVTFTNKAAGEMMERIKQLLGLPYSTPPYSQYLPHVGTFHSICVKILRKEIEKIGYKRNFVIYDDQDQLAVMKRAMKELGVSADQIKPNAILYAISDAKNKLIDAKLFAESVGSYFEEQVSKCFSHYQKQLKQADALDFDDIILLTVKIFKKYPEILERYQELFRYIMVDEYQDTNHAQYTFLRMLAQKYQNICVVGDDWQCLPADTKIKIDKGWQEIEKIKKGDWVWAAGGRGDVCMQKVTRVKQHNYKGYLLEIFTKKGKKIKCTPNHILFSKLSLKKNIFYVYLMYHKEFGYRIGQVKGSRYQKRENKNCIGLNIRANQERADRMWILKVVGSKEEAWYWEQYLSLKYQIPTAVFLAKEERQMKFGQELINRLFEEIDTEKNAANLFQDFCLSFDYPHHAPQATIRFGTNRKNVNLVLFCDKRKSMSSPWNGHRISINSADKRLKSEIEKLKIPTRRAKGSGWRSEISNLDFGKLESLGLEIAKKIEGISVVRKAFISKDKPFSFHPAGHLRETMELGILAENQISEDEIISVKKVPYEGKVYDIDVKNVHNYIADGIVVHNSIYGWRGADVQNILDFEKDYPQAKVFLLEQNYRSTQNILDAAHGVISKNVNRKDKKLWTENDKGDPLILFEAADEKDEAQFVIERIKEMKKEKGRKLDDFAILYRTNAQSRALEEAFLKEGIPYKIIGGLKFYQRKEIKDILAYLYLIQNPNDRTSFERIINEPKRGLGAKTVASILSIADHEKVDILKVLKGFDPKEFADAQLKIPKAKIKILKDFANFVERMREVNSQTSVSKLIEKVYRESGYESMLAKTGEEGAIRHENVQELLTVARKYNDQEDGLLIFLEEVALVSQTDRDLDAKEMVPLMTLHSAKGLEYDVIFIVGMEEGLLPHSRAVLNENEMEEERRLCYVGITRAKKHAHLIYTSSRNIYGSTQISVRSRFVDEIDNKLFELRYSENSSGLFSDEFSDGLWDSRKQKKGFIKSTFSDFEKQIDLNDEDDEVEVFESDFSDGEKVSHLDFGMGIVISQDEKTVSVAFAGVGLKKLAKGIAPLKKI